MPVKPTKKYILSAALTLACLLSAIFVPSFLSQLQDKALVGDIRFSDAGPSASGYRYKPSRAERIDLYSRSQSVETSADTYTSAESTLAQDQDKTAALQAVVEACPAQAEKLTRLGLLPPITDSLFSQLTH